MEDKKEGISEDKIEEEGSQITPNPIYPEIDTKTESLMSQSPSPLQALLPKPKIRVEEQIYCPSFLPLLNSPNNLLDILQFMYFHEVLDLRLLSRNSYAFIWEHFKFIRPQYIDDPNTWQNDKFRILFGHITETNRNTQYKLKKLLKYYALYPNNYIIYISNINLPLFNEPHHTIVPIPIYMATDNLYETPMLKTQLTNMFALDKFTNIFIEYPIICDTFWICLIEYIKNTKNLEKLFIETKLDFLSDNLKEELFISLQENISLREMTFDSFSTSISQIANLLYINPKINRLSLDNESHSITDEKFNSIIDLVKHGNELEYLSLTDIDIDESEDITDAHFEQLGLCLQKNTSIRELWLQYFKVDKFFPYLAHRNNSNLTKLLLADIEIETPGILDNLILAITTSGNLTDLVLQRALCGEMEDSAYKFGKLVDAIFRLESLVKLKLNDVTLPTTEKNRIAEKCIEKDNLEKFIMKEMKLEVNFMEKYLFRLLKLKNLKLLNLSENLFKTREFTGNLDIGANLINISITKTGLSFTKSGLINILANNPQIVKLSVGEEITKEFSLNYWGTEILGNIGKLSKTRLKYLRIVFTITEELTPFNIDDEDDEDKYEESMLLKIGFVSLEAIDLANTIKTIIPQVYITITKVFQKYEDEGEIYGPF